MLLMKLVMIEVATGTGLLYEYTPPRGFIEVTSLSCYENYAIYNGSIKVTDVIIEGTDGVEKTTVISKLLKDGIVCQDRCMDMISKNMLFTIPTKNRANMYQEYLKETDKKIIVFSK